MCCLGCAHHDFHQGWHGEFNKADHFLSSRFFFLSPTRATTACAQSVALYFLCLVVKTCWIGHYMNLEWAVCSLTWLDYDSLESKRETFYFSRISNCSSKVARPLDNAAMQPLLKRRRTRVGARFIQLKVRYRPLAEGNLETPMRPLSSATRDGGNLRHRKTAHAARGVATLTVDLI